MRSSSSLKREISILVFGLIESFTSFPGDNAMPFIKKSNTQSSSSSTPPQSVFIGRANELLFFIQHILKPDEPVHNILSIWGQGGVGKTTLLQQFKNQAATADFKAYCLTALVDERQATPASMMEKFVHQLHLGSPFEKALQRYKEALQFLPLSTSPSSLQDRVVTRVPDLAGALVEGVVPVVGPLLGEGIKATTEYLLDLNQPTKAHTAAVKFNDPLERLTQVFLTELNHLAATKIAVPSTRTKRERKILLFFDTFEQVADEAVPWLLHSVLEMEINPNIVFIIAGRDPLERSTANGPKSWLPYYDTHTLYALPVQPFTQEETTAYLAERGITTKERIDTIWHLSRGLPLYLGLLTSNRAESIDPTKDVVDNFLQRIPANAPMKRQLALDAALFSKPFNLDDLEAFPYLSDQDRPVLYAWLLRQPFLRASSLGGRYLYHDIAQEIFQRYLYQHSPKAYYATRRTLAAYYQRLLEPLQTAQEKNRYDPSDERLEVLLALVSQLFFLPDEASHFQAISPLFTISNYDNSIRNREQERIMLRTLSGIVRTLSLSQSGSHAHHLAQSIVRFLETMPTQYDQRQKQEWLQAADHLLKLLSSSLSTSSEHLASFYLLSGWGYSFLGKAQTNGIKCSQSGSFSHIQEYQQAQACFERVLEMHPHSALAYSGLGTLFHDLKDYQQAVEHFNRALQLSPHDPYLYYGRGRAYGRLKAYPQALSDLGYALQLHERDFKPYHNRARISMELKEYYKALADLDRVLEVDPEHPLTAHIHFERGCVYLRLKDLTQANACFAYSCQLASVWCQDIFLWVKEWSRMCHHAPDSQTREHLKALTAEGGYVPPPTFGSSRPAHPPHICRPYIACICRGVLFWLDKAFEKALVELQQAASLDYDQDWPYLAREYWCEWDVDFWKGMTYAMLNRDEEAKIAVERALELTMPPLLLRPLSWLELEKPLFYNKYVKPLFVSYGVE
jgi:tetratricopeptide (TPR) repeat protein